MGPLLKLLLVALLTLPVGAFAVGRLSGAATVLEQDRAPVVLEDPVRSEPQETITGGPAVRGEAGREDEPGEGRGEGRGDAAGPRVSGPVEVVGPGPTDLVDDREDEVDDRHGEGGDDGDRRGGDGDELDGDDEPDGNDEPDGDERDADERDGDERDEEERDEGDQEPALEDHDEPDDD